MEEVDRVRKELIAFDECWWWWSLIMVDGEDITEEVIIEWWWERIISCLVPSLWSIAFSKIWKLFQFLVALVVGGLIDTFRATSFVVLQTCRKTREECLQTRILCSAGARKKDLSYTVCCTYVPYCWGFSFSHSFIFIRFINVSEMRGTSSESRFRMNQRFYHIFNFTVYYYIKWWCSMMYDDHRIRRGYSIPILVLPITPYKQ